MTSIILVPSQWQKQRPKTETQHSNTIAICVEDVCTILSFVGTGRLQCFDMWADWSRPNPFRIQWRELFCTGLRCWGKWRLLDSKFFMCLYRACWYFSSLEIFCRVPCFELCESLSNEFLFLRKYGIRTINHDNYPRQEFDLVNCIDRPSRSVGRAPDVRKRTKQKPNWFIYPDVDRNRPIRKEVNDWYGVGFLGFVGFSPF